MKPVLSELIAGRIRTSGPISFAEFMDLALYHPELGYYARAPQRTGRAGDFFTSVDVGAVFGELLARQFAEMWRLLQARSPIPDHRLRASDSSALRRGSPKLAGEFERQAEAARSPSFDLVEAGAGNGRLARDVLDAAARDDPEFYAAIRLSLVELSPSARAAQAATLGPHSALLGHSSSTLPEHIHGVIFANELLDALPTHAVAMTDNGLREVFVDEREGEFVEQLRDLSTPRIAEYLSRAGASMRRGWRAEVNLAAEDWIKNAARALDEGFLLVIDYGHEASELYGATHASGTLTTFTRHTSGLNASHADGLGGALQDPGMVDITAHVDLTGVTKAAEHEGMTVLGRLDQTYFMMGVGLDAMMNAAQGFEPSALRRRLALKTLMLPGGLGSTHKVLVFGRNVGAPRLRCVAYRERLT